MNYGIPYMGSKSKICDKVCRLFPKADNFYDLFGGGFSVTHFMLKHRAQHYKHFHFNEIRSGAVEVIKKAVNGEYSYENFQPPWVTKEEFEQKKDSCFYTKIIWSFGNNGTGYLFGKDIEQHKKSMHMAVVFNEFDEYAKQIFGMEKFKDGYSINDKRLLLRNRIIQLHKGKIKSELQQLQQLQQLERLSFYNTSYENVPIKENSVIYCDIPYKSTADYGSEFSHAKFFDWANEQKEPVFISEYNVDDKRFKQIANFKKRSMISPNKDETLIKDEKVYVNQAGYRKLMSR